MAVRPLLVIGLGNPMRGDDGAGAEIARRLAAEPTVSATIVRHRQLLPEMADTVADACLIVPTVDAETVTPHAEAFQAVLWHLLVSHPEVQATRAKWESVA